MATTHELSTLGHVIKPAYESQPDTNAFTDAEKSKLAGVEPEATKNATDAQLRDRSTHTGTQTAATIIDLPDLLATKVDVVAGKTLTDANFTAAEKAKLAGLEDAHFKGVHVGLSGLQDAHPTGQAGDYAVVDDGVDLTWYQWDGAAWAARVGESTEVTPAQVKSYYESNPDTNAFTDAYKAYIDGVVGNNRFTWRRRGTWNAATNTPALLDGTGTHGDFYVVTTAGTQNLGNGAHSFVVGDFVLFEGGTWKPLPMAPRATTWAAVTGKPNVYVQRGMIGPSIPALRLRASSNQTLTASSYHVLNKWSIGYDQFSMHDGNGKFTVPSWANHARVTSTVYFDPMATDRVIRLRAYKNSTMVTQGTSLGAGAGNYTSPFVDTGIIDVSGGDELDIRIWHNGTSDRQVYSSLSDFVNIELFSAS